VILGKNILKSKELFLFKKTQLNLSLVESYYWKGFSEYANEK